MATVYRVQTSELDSAKNTVSSIATQYGEKYASLFATIKAIKSGVNEGEDIDEFINKVTPYEKNFAEMKEALDKFATHLEQSSAAYKETEKGNKQRVSNI